MSALLLTAGCLYALFAGSSATVCRVSSIPTEHGYRAGEVATCDLDGNGTVDPVTVRFFKDTTDAFQSFELVVGAESLLVHGEYLDASFAILDVDTSDAQLEIAVPESGPSDDYATHFFAYHRGHIVPLETLPGSSELHANGSGIVRTSIRGEVLCTWYHDAEYRLGSDGALTQIPLLRYAMNMRVTMKRGLTLMPSPWGGHGPVRLRRREAATLVSSDDRTWVDVMNSKGNVGRCSIDLDGRLADQRLDPTDVFDGMSFAD